jgi:hypothetical protein
MRYSGGWRTAGAGSTTLPAAALVAGANNEVRVIEIGVWNTTATECNVAVRRHTTAGTPGSGQSEIPWNVDTGAASATLLDTYTSTGPTLTSGAYRWATLGAAKGSGIIWTFGDTGLILPKGTTQGICIIPGTGTGQILDVYFEWIE